MTEDWIECKLGEILIIERGGSPRPIKEYITDDEDGVNWIKIADATKSGKYILKTIQKIKPSGLKRSREVFPGDLLLSNSMSFGRPYIMGIKGAIHDGWLVIRDNKYLDKDYLYYALGSPTTFNQFSKKAKGSTVKNLNIVIVSDVTIKVNPLLIQKAIVKKIEELFSSLDSGIADLKKAQDQLVIYRQAVLKKAFEGFKEIPFDEIITSSQNGISKRKGTEGKEIKVLRLADISNLEIDNSNSRKIVLNDKELEKYKLNEGDLIIIRVNGSINLVGRFIHVKKQNETELWTFCDHFIRVTLDLSICVPKFYYYFFQLSQVRKFINLNMVSSAGQNTVSQGTVKSISVPLCSIDEQHQIVSDIESRLSVCDKVEKDIAYSLEKAQALRQSILKKAFEGTLLSEAEIAKCKADTAYEPASVLLEKIKVEKS